MADLSSSTPSRFGKIIVLLICFLLLVVPLFSIRSVVFYSGVMPFALWTSKIGNHVSVVSWMLAIFVIYAAIGITGVVKNSWLVVLAVPTLAIFISLIALFRFGAGVGSF